VAGGVTSVAAVDPVHSVERFDVQTTQPAIIRAMWEWANRTNVSAQVTGTAPFEMTEISIPPVEVDPVVVKWMVEPPQPALPSVLPIIRRVAADEAERSAK
jgi:hypothetical protein